MTHENIPRKRIIERKPCKEVRLSPFQSFISILSLLGISVIIGLVFMIIVFFGERYNIVPYFGVIYMSNLSEGENWILFFSFFIFAIFLGVIVIWVIYRSIRLKNCTDIGEELEEMESL